MAKKILLDLGAHHGKSIDALGDWLDLKDDWEIHMFEPNPACFLADRMQGSKWNVRVHATAAWIEDGTVAFSQQNHRLARNQSPADGRSDVDGWGSTISALRTRHPALLPPIIVPSIDLAQLLRSFAADDFIAVKMDIEGAEFRVLRHLLDQGVCGRIGVLFIEWHLRLLQDETPDSQKSLEDALHSQGVLIRPWG